MIKAAPRSADTKSMVGGGRVLKLEIDGEWWMRGRDGRWKVWDYTSGEWQPREAGPPTDKIPATFSLEKAPGRRAQRQPSYWRDAKLRIMSITLACLAVIAFAEGEVGLAFVAGALCPLVLFFSLRHIHNRLLVTVAIAGVTSIAAYYWWFHADSGFRWRVGIMVALAIGSYLVRDHLPASNPNVEYAEHSKPSAEAPPARLGEAVPVITRWISSLGVFLAIAAGSVLTSSDSLVQGLAVGVITAACCFYVVTRWAHIVAIVAIVLGSGLVGAVWFLSSFALAGWGGSGTSARGVLGALLMFSGILYAMVNLVVLVITSSRGSGLGFGLWPPTNKLGNKSEIRVITNSSSTPSTPPSE